MVRPLDGSAIIGPVVNATLEQQVDELCRQLLADAKHMTAQAELIDRMLDGDLAARDALAGHPAPRKSR